jgi:two-component system, cell cycle sensor histidine kinase and response regulator CckA
MDNENETDDVREARRRIWCQTIDLALTDDEVAGMEEALAGIGRQKDLLLDNMRELVLYKDRNLNVLWANKTVYKAFDAKPEEIIGRPCYEALHKLERPCPGCPSEEAIRTGQPAAGETRLPDEQSWRKRSYPVLDGTGAVKGVVEVASDITRHRRDRRLLQESEERYRMLVENAPDIIFSLGKDGRVTSANPALERITGWTPSELAGTAIVDLIHPDDQPDIIENFSQLLNGKGEAVLEARVRSKSGEYVYLECHLNQQVKAGEVTGISGVGLDLTRRNRALEALKKSEARYRALVESSSDAILMLDEQRDIKSCNKAFLRMFGYRMEEITGQSTRILHPSEESFLHFGSTAYSIIEKNDTFRTEWDLVRRNGRTFPVETVTSAIREEGGRVSGYVAIIRDITERRQAEAKLNGERRRLQILSENAPFSMAMIDSRGNYTYVNLKFTEMFGYDVQDVPDGNTWFNTAFPDPVARAFAVSTWVNDVKDMRPGERKPRIFKVTCKDGTEKTVNLISVRLENGEFLETGEDITERMRADETLRQTNETLHAVVMASPLAIVSLDRDGKVTIWNEAAERMLGWKASEVLGKDYPAVPTAGEADFQSRFLEGYHTESPKGVELERLKKDGSIITVNLFTAPMFDGDGNVVASVGVLADITDRKKTEELLKESEAKYRNIIEESLVGAYISQDGVMKYVNKRFCEIHGYTYDEIVNRMGPLDLVYTDDKGIVEESMRKRLAGEISVDEYEFRAVRKDGEVITAKIIGGVMSYGGVMATAGTILDITKEKVLEQQLLQAQKMEAIGTLAGGIAHDFNNILTAIIGYSNLLQMRMDKDDPLRAYVDRILASSQTAVQLTYSLLAFSRKQVIELRPHQMNAIVGGIEKLLGRLLTEDIDLRVKLAVSDLTIMADATQMDQVLMNLATNARDAMPQGGMLSIEVKPAEIDSRFIRAHGFGKAGLYGLISVSDTGIGMDGVIKKKIFEPFFTTKEVGKGTGLGLSIVYGIVKQHNGFINVYSEPGKGTTFNIYLPVVKAAMERKEAELPRAEGGSETLLIAEDNSEVRKLTKEILENTGYTVIEAADGEEAIRMFEKNRERIGLVVLDVVMPRKNGKEVYDEVKKIKPDVKVLFTSGYTSDIVFNKGVYDPSFDFISKPAPPNELLQKVREVLDRP